MFRIIGGVAYEGEASKDRWHVSLVELGHGHREACVQRAIDWREVATLQAEKPTCPGALVLDPKEAAAAYKRHHDDEADREERDALRSARRAKTNVRRRCKALGLDTLLTLTYKGLQSDLELCKAHTKQFLRRIREAYRAAGLEQFDYVGCFEPQKRGAWHVHFAVRRLPRSLAASNGVKVAAHKVIRAIWLRVVGEWGGNIDDGRRMRQSRKSPAKCAAYLSKYVLKMHWQAGKHANSYIASKCDQPKPQRLEFRAATMAELIGLVVGDWAADGGRVVATTWLSPFGDVFFVAGERAG